MAEKKWEWLGRFLPQPNTASRAEQLRGAAGGLVGLLLTGSLTILVLGVGSESAFLIAPMGASAVLLFGAPASPLAQPWNAVGGNVVSATIGVTVAHLIEQPLLAAPLACCMAIAAMFVLRCLHPPGGAVALTAVLAGPAVHAAGYQFVLFPVGLNTTLLVLAALLFNNLTGRRFPHVQHSPLQNVHATRDLAPTARLGFTNADLDAVIERYDQVLDVSRDDLETIILETEMRAYARHFGVITCADIMSKDVITLEFGSSLDEAWHLMRRHQVHALPVLNPARRVIGIVAQSDFLRHGELNEYRTYAERLRRFIRPSKDTHSDKPEVVGQIMTCDVKTARDDLPIVELVPLMANTGVHHVPVLDHEHRFVGIVTQSDLIAALYESRLAEAERAPSVAPRAIKPSLA